MDKRIDELTESEIDNILVNIYQNIDGIVKMKMELSQSDKDVIDEQILWTKRLQDTNATKDVLLKEKEKFKIKS